MDHLHSARVCIEVNTDAVLPSKIFLNCSASESESYTVLEVELADSWFRKGRCHSLDRSQLDALPKQNGLKSSGTPATISQVKLCECQKSGYENAPDSDPLDVVSCSMDQDGLEPDLGLPLLTAASPMSGSVNPMCTMARDYAFFPCCCRV
ncbi:hypothetical protein Nepgr_007830 [Nepenthes gracilis]|uniref:Uncharacterized protein n=1 Tax=Nepenthes gracilis TaxID=150966 RepID=A0AAD3S7P6_NEPGR|nr:hypothetical protein Nepgr_007830 [Nepenthes gracilis]